MTSMMDARSTAIGFFDYASGRRIAVEHFRFDAGDMWEQIEHRAAEIARVANVVVDIHTSVRMPSGRIHAWERAGIRVGPPGAVS